jgi:tetratricopeptide (TPR) repeat protein
MNFERAEHLRQTGRYAEAAEVFLGFATESSNDLEQAGALLNAANCFELSGDIERARTALNRAVTLAGPQKAMQHAAGFLEACLKADEGNVSEALRRLKRISDGLDDDEFELRQSVEAKQGMLLASSGRYEEAVTLLENVRANHEMRSLVLYFLGVCYREIGRLKESKQVFAEALNLGLPLEFTTKAHYYRGLVFYALGELEQAKREFEVCESSSDRDIPASYVFSMLAATHKYLGDSARAQEYERLSKA